MQFFHFGSKMTRCSVCIINEQNRLFVVLTKVLSSSFDSLPPLNMLLLSPQICITRCHTLLVTSVAFASMDVGERTGER